MKWFIASFILIFISSSLALGLVAGLLFIKVDDMITDNHRANLASYYAEKKE